MNGHHFGTAENKMRFQYTNLRKSISTSAVVSKKNGTFICELILERYIYLRDTQKQLKF